MNQISNSSRFAQWLFIVVLIIVLVACGDSSSDKKKPSQPDQDSSQTIGQGSFQVTAQDSPPTPVKDSPPTPVKDSSPTSVKDSSPTPVKDSPQTPVKDSSQTEFKILDFAERSYKGVSSLGIVLSVPLSSKSDWQKYLVLERQDGQRVDGTWIMSDNGRELFFKNIEPETDYLVTVYANLKANNEQELGQRFKQSLTTRPIEASVGFAHDGGILPLTSSRGLPVYSININQVDVEFHRIKTDKMLAFLKQWSGGKEGAYQLQRYAEQADFVYSARFDLPVEKNKRERAILPIENIDELKPAGIYLVVMKTPGQYEYRQAVTYFIHSDIGVHIRRYPGKLNAYLRSLVSGKSLQGVNVSLLDKNGRQLIQMQSDDKGMAHFDIAQSENLLKKAHLLLARKNQQMSLVRLNSPALDLSEFNIGQHIQQQNEAFFYAPRDLYRPGERVDISLLLRDFDGRLIPDIPLKAVIKRADGQIMERFTWHPDKLAYYHHVYQLSDNARTGKWSIEVQLPGAGSGKLSSEGQGSSRQWHFSVEDFLPERLKLSLQERPDGQYLRPEETLTIPVDGQYLYGAPASGNRLQTQINTFIDQNAIASLPDYLFGLAEEEESTKSYFLKDTQLDEQGKVNLEIPSKWRNIESPLAIRVTSSLFETGGRAVKRQAMYRVWPGETLIGIRPHEKEPQANTLLGFDIINADKSGQLYEADNLQVSLIKKRRDYYWKYNDSDEWEMDFSEKHYPVLQQTISITKGEKARLEVPVEWGFYRLEITNPATRLTSSVEFNAGGSWYSENQQARTARPDQVNLILDKPHYLAGDTAQLTIKSPFTGQGVILVENNEQLLWQKDIELQQTNELTIEIPVQNNWDRHDIYISTVFFNDPNKSSNKGGDSSNDSTQQTIKRAIGLIHLPLDRSSRHLDLSIESADKSRPFTTLPVKIRLENRADITDKEIMITLAAVDVGVLNVSNFVSPDPFAWFFAQRRYSVDSLDLYGNIMDGRTGIMGKQRYGGDMDLSSAGNLQKAKVKIVSLFHQPVLFNAQGEAEISLDIPDFNGQLRLMAVAFGETSYGHSEQNIIIAAPLVTQLSMPRFLSANDESQFTLDVHNLSEQQQSLAIKLSTDDVIEIIEPLRELTLEHNVRTTLHFSVKSKKKFGLSDINLHIANLTDEINFHREWQLAVRPAYPAVIRNKQQIIAKDETLQIKIATNDLMTESLQGELLISNQPPINLPLHLKHLLKYPYGCLEQTTSSSFPWLFAKPENIDKLGLNTIKIKNQPVDFSQREQHIARGIQRLSAKQLSNGGFGLWNNQGNEEFWLSVYASHFLLQAREQGIEVPQAVLKPAIKRLQQYLRSARPGYEYRYSQYPEHLTLAYKAYAAYVLSSIVQAPLGTMRTLYDYHQKDAHSGLPLMHLGIALIRQGDLKRGKQAIDRSLLIRRDANAYLGDYGSTLRDLSLMLEALVEYQPSHPGINTLLYQLQEELTKRQWLSTQERNALFLAGVALKQTDQKQWQAIINTAMPPGEQKIIHEGDFQPVIDRQDIREGVTLKSLTDERLYVSLDISGYTKNSPEPEMQHFNITRTYYNSSGKMILPEQVAVGELLIVELSLQAKNRIQDALVVDLLPAGFEIENQNLAHSIKLDQYRIGDKAVIDKMSSNDIKYQAYRDDRYVAAIDLNGHSTQRLYYLLRAVTPGTYQVPPPYAEDMYRPYIRAIGDTPEPQSVLNRNYQM